MAPSAPEAVGGVAPDDAAAEASPHRESDVSVPTRAMLTAPAPDDAISEDDDEVMSATAVRVCDVTTTATGMMMGIVWDLVLGTPSDRVAVALGVTRCVGDTRSDRDMVSVLDMAAVAVRRGGRTGCGVVVAAANVVT